MHSCRVRYTCNVWRAWYVCCACILWMSCTYVALPFCPFMPPTPKHCKNMWFSWNPFRVGLPKVSPKCPRDVPRDAQSRNGFREIVGNSLLFRKGARMDLQTCSRRRRRPSMPPSPKHCKNMWFSWNPFRVGLPKVSPKCPRDVPRDAQSGNGFRENVGNSLLFRKGARMDLQTCSRRRHHPFMPPSPKHVT